MGSVISSIMKMLFGFVKMLLIPVAGLVVLFVLLCLIWALIIRFRYGMKMQPSGVVRLKKKGILYQIFVELPRRYMLDRFEKEADYFEPRGIHMFCGEQGSGKTCAAAEMILRLQHMYPKAKCTTNFALTTENDALNAWQMLLEYSNGHQGVIVGIDEIQNWFMSGTNKLPQGMLEIVTQNRKNCRILICTSQVFTRVNKGLREQVTMVYNPHTIFGCLTVVIKRKPVFDSEGNVIEMKFRGMYSFVHTDELRASYDTYKVIHTLAKEGFKEMLPVNVQS